MRKLLLLMFPALLAASTACTSTQRRAALECDEAAVASYVPRIEAAVLAHDKAELAKLATELGADMFACGIKALAARPAAGSGSGSAK